jgi:hypothetical protein
MAQGYQDVVNGYNAGKKIGGNLEDKFATDYGAATAAARANGTLNEDAIVANLVTMGAVPSNAAVVLKQALAGQGGNLSSIGQDAMRWVRGNLYKGPNSEKTRELWYKNTLENIKQGMATVGYSVGAQAPAADNAAPAAPAAPRAPESAKDKLVKEHAAKRESKAKSKAKGALTKSGKPVQSF